MYDLIIRNGNVFDGLGSQPIEADVAVENGKIAKVGKNLSPGREEIDAKGQIVTPGFVDVHTHFDGQVTWDPYLQPSTCHGVTTVIMGNCGVGFAPCAASRHDWLIGLMEGVEDIPGTALTEGIKWNWESFPEYMDAVENSPLSIDVGLQIPHGAVRTFVMGERGARLEPANADDVSQMAALVQEGIEAGALGFSTTRTEKHRDRNGAHAPTFKSEALELHGISKAVGETGKGVLQLIGDFWDFEPEFELIKGMAAVSGRPLSVTIEQDDRHPDIWSRLLEGITQAQSEGINMKGQVPARPTGILFGLTTTICPLSLLPSYREVFRKPLADKVAALKDQAFRKRIVNEELRNINNELAHFMATAYHKMYELGEIPDYEPDPSTSVAAIAEREGKHPREIIMDILAKNDGQALIYLPLMNYLHGNMDDVHTMITHPFTSFGLGDAGAHCGIVCDASFQSTWLTHWGRDRTRGPKLPLEWIIKKMTKDSATLVGLHDRGTLEPGMQADVNVIDFDNLTLYSPRMISDLPAGGRRLMQKAKGYTASIVHGEVAFRDGEPVGPLNGRLIRGAQPRPIGH